MFVHVAVLSFPARVGATNWVAFVGVPRLKKITKRIKAPGSIKNFFSSSPLCTDMLTPSTLVKPQKLESWNSLLVLEIKIIYPLFLIRTIIRFLVFFTGINKGTIHDSNFVEEKVWIYLRIKVRPHGQQFSRTTRYNKVVRHKTCRGHAKSCATNVHTSTIFFINLVRLQRKKITKNVQITLRCVYTDKNLVVQLGTTWLCETERVVVMQKVVVRPTSTHPRFF